jgi:type IX secretion system PorP/SprF family membrane protein
MIRNIYFICFLFLLMFVESRAQQLYHFNQYLFNDLILNPAVAGTKPCKIIGLDYRKQWIGFDGSPTTQDLFFHGHFFKRTGLGAIVYNDKAGAAGMLGGELDYAFHAIRNSRQILSFGLGATVLQYSLNQTGFVPEIPGDPSVDGSNPKKITYDIAGGVYYKNNYFLVSFGAKHLLQPKLNISNTNDNKIIRHYYLTVSYNFWLRNDIRCEPSVFLRMIGPPMPQVDLAARFIFRDLFWLGLDYRLRDGLIGFGGIELGGFTLGYGYDYTLSRIMPYNSGTHELFLSYKICSKGDRQGSTGAGLRNNLQTKGKRGTKSNQCPVW